jgi:acid phosphatase (class A)
MVRNDGSYPSARGAVGWAYGLLLAELRPQRAAEIDARARQFGQSRIICDQEWESDVEAAKLVASATLARERASPAFRADIDAARKEVAASVEARPSLDCKGEPIPIASR